MEDLFPKNRMRKVFARFVMTSAILLELPKVIFMDMSRDGEYNIMPLFQDTIKSKSSIRWLHVHMITTLLWSFLFFLYILGHSRVTKKALCIIHAVTSCVILFNATNLGLNSAWVAVSMNVIILVSSVVLLYFDLYFECFALFTSPVWLFDWVYLFKYFCQEGAVGKTSTAVFQLLQVTASQNTTTIQSIAFVIIIFAWSLIALWFCVFPEAEDSNEKPKEK